MDCSSSHLKAQNSAQSVSVAKRSKKPLISSPCGGNSEKSLNRTCALWRAFSKKCSPKSLAGRTAHHSDTIIQSCSKGLLQLRKSCSSCESLRTMEDFKLSKKAYLAESQAAQISDTQLKPRMHKNIQVRLESLYAAGDCYQTPENNPFSHKNGAYEVALTNAVSLPAEEQLVSQAFDQTTNDFCSSTVDARATKRTHESMDSDQRRENFEDSCFFDAISCACCEELWPVIAEPQEEKSLQLVSDQFMIDKEIRINPKEITSQTTSDRQESTLMGACSRLPAIVSHLTETNSPGSSSSFSGSLELSEDRWDVTSLSDVQHSLSADLKADESDSSGIINRITGNQAVIQGDALCSRCKSTLAKKEHGTCVSDRGITPREAHLDRVADPFRPINAQIMTKLDAAVASAWPHPSVSVDSSSRPACDYPISSRVRRSLHTVGSIRLDPQKCYTPVPDMKMSASSNIKTSMCVKEKNISHVVDPKQRKAAWAIATHDHAGETLAVKTSTRSGAMRKLESSFGESRTSFDLHRYTKVWNVDPGEKTATAEGHHHDHSLLKDRKISSEKIMPEFKSRDFLIETAFSSYTSKAFEPAAISTRMQGIIQGFPSSVPSPGSNRDHHRLKTISRELRTAKSFDAKSIVVRRLQQGSSHSCPLPALRPPRHSFLKSLPVSSKAKPVCSSGMTPGLLECIRSGEAMSFRFIAGTNREILIAESSNSANLYNGRDGAPLFTFFACTEKGKENSGGWKQWRNKPERSVSVVGAMHIADGGKAEVDGHDKHILQSELQFVLLGAGSNESGCDIRDVKRLNSGPAASFVSGLHRDGKVCKNLSYQLGTTELDPPQLSHELANRRSESLITDAADQKLQLNFPKQLKTELLAIVIQLPTDSQTKVNPLRESARSRLRGLEGFSASSELILRDNLTQKSQCNSFSLEGVNTPCNSVEPECNKSRQNINLSAFEDGLAMNNFERLNQVNGEHVTIILPAGQHGCPTLGFEGPQPLLQRWKSDGKCDCGSWDLGCGLLILRNDTSCSLLKRHQGQNGSLKMFIEGSKQKGIAMTISHIYGGQFAVSFQEPMSSLQTFGAAVALLYSGLKHPILSMDKKNPEFVKLRPPRVPLQMIDTSKSASEVSMRRYEVYSRGCHPDPPLSLVERV